MSRTLTAAIHESLSLAGPVDRIEATKNAVSDHLASFDRTATIRQTEYFNHSFAPDIVMTWGRGKRERLVYLRPTSDPVWIADELRAFGHTKPIVITLDGHQRSAEDDAASRHLSDEARLTRTLVTEPAAIDAIRGRREPIADLFGQAVVRAGRGVFDERDAHRAATTTVSGFAAAQRLDVVPTRAATSLVMDVLDDEHAGRVNRILRAVWEGHGGAPTEFPVQGATTARGDLDKDDLILLLGALETSDLAFWRRIGQNLSLPLLTSLPLTEPSPNLAHLIAASLDRLAARAVRVFREPPDLFEQSPEIHWLISRGCLVLGSAMWRAYFAAKGDALPEPAQEFAGASAAKILAFARDEGLRTIDLRVRRTDIAITFEAIAADTNVAESKDVADIAHRSDTIAHTATLDAGGRALVVDLISGTAGGHTSATFSLLDFGRIALPLLLRDEDGHDQELDQIFVDPTRILGEDVQLMLEGLLNAPQGET